MGGRQLGAEALPDDDWDEPDVRKTREDAEKAGRGRKIPPFELPTPVVPKGPSKGPAEKPKTIDPGIPVVDTKTKKFKEDLKERFPKIRDVILELEDIEKREFWNKAPTNMSGDTTQQIFGIIEQVREAMLYRAIVENWDRETLLTQYERAIVDYYTRAASRPFFYEVGGQMVRAWHWFVTPENLGKGENKNLTEGPEKREISPRYRGRIAIKLMVVEHKIKNEILHPNWKIDPDVNENQLKFVENEAIPLYRFFVIDEAIVNNISAEDKDNDGIPDAIYNRYVPILTDLYTSALKKE